MLYIQAFFGQENYVFASIAIFILGAIIGSFLNVVIYRFNTGMTVGGRSKCFSCGRFLNAFDLVPILSFLSFCGRCRTCKSKISWQYPLIEILTGVLFLFSYMSLASMVEYFPIYFIFKFAISLIVMCLLVVIFVYDLKHKIIPDSFSYAFALITLVSGFFAINLSGGLVFNIPSGFYMLAGPILALPFYLIWLLSGGRWMGLGDAKLALGIGWFLGLTAGASAIMIGFWVGAIISVSILIFQHIIKNLKKAGLIKKIYFRALSMKSEVPFAPFLIIGLLIVYFLKYNIIGTLLLPW